jgi:hypothetical protein
VLRDRRRRHRQHDSTASLDQVVETHRLLAASCCADVAHQRIFEDRDNIVLSIDDDCLLILMPSIEFNKLIFRIPTFEKRAFSKITFEKNGIFQNDFGKKGCFPK